MTSDQDGIAGVKIIEDSASTSKDFSRDWLRPAHFGGMSATSQSQKAQGRPVVLLATRPGQL